jgi:hypothetical protein
LRAAAGSPLVQLRRRNRRRARILRRSVAGLVLLALAGVVLGLAFAGSPGRVPAGVRIAGVAVGGLSAADATQLLERRARALAHTPVVFTAAGRRWKLTPAQLELRVDWKAAVTIARRQGDGFAPLRGFRRLGMRVFGADVSPPTRVYGAALAYELDQISGGVNRRPLDASLVRRGLQARIVRGQAGRGLDRAAAAGVIVRALAGFSRRPVALPLRLA